MHTTPAGKKQHGLEIKQRFCNAVLGICDVEIVITTLAQALSDETGFIFNSLSIFDATVKNLRKACFADTTFVWTSEPCVADTQQYNRSEIHNGLVTIPLRVRDIPVGILEVRFSNTIQTGIPPEDMQFLDDLAAITAKAVEPIRLFNELNYERYQLHALMNNIPDAIYFKDRESRFIRASKALAEKIGLSDPSDLLGKTDFDLFTTEHAQQAFDDEQKILATAIPTIDIVEKETWQDSRITWVSTTKMPLRDSCDHIIGTFGVSRDITRRKEMEEALRFRLKFEAHITSLSSKFINLNLHSIDDAIFDALRVIGEFTASDRSIVLLLNKKKTTSIEHTFEWHADGIASSIKSNRRTPLHLSEQFWSTLKNGTPIIITTGKDLPGDTLPGNAVFTETKVQSLLYVPLIYGNSFAGMIGIESFQCEKSWPEDTTTLLTIVGEVFMNALSRKDAEEKLQNANNILELRVAERTEDLKKSNELLKSNIEQLNYLNTSVYNLSPIITVEKLLPAILDVFTVRFPHAQGGLCYREDDAFVFASATTKLAIEPNRCCLEKAISLILHTEPQSTLFIENRTADEHLCGISFTDIDNLVSTIAIPFFVDSSCKALLLLLTTPEDAATYAREQTLLTTLAAHAAICLTNAVHYQEHAEKARIDGELNAARSIQRRFTPQHQPDIPHVDLYGVYYPANQVGGDYLDYFQTEQGDWVVAIADVCGKGIPAALLMTTMRSVFRIEAKNETSARRLLCAVNQFMAINLDDKSFVTALCLIIAKDGSEMTYARAGHPMLIQQQHNGVCPENVISAGAALGLIQDASTFSEILEEKSIPLHAGDCFLMYTDGLIDASNLQRDSYGYPRLLKFLAEHRDSEPEQLIGGIVADVKQFTLGAPYYDDLTMLALRVF